MLSRQGIFFSSLKGEVEDVQEMPAPESTPGSVLAANLSITLQEEDRSEGNNLPSSSTSESALQCDAGFKEDAGEDTALLGKCLPGYKTMLLAVREQNEKIHKMQKNIKEK